MTVHDTSPAARALLVLEMIQNSPGIAGERLAERLGLSDRAIRRQVAVLREAGIPVESTRGRYGGYRIGRGMRLPPLMFTPAEAIGLVMAVLEGHPAGETDPVGQALGKIVRALPEQLARPADAVRRVAARGWDVVVPDVETTARLVQACDAGERLRLQYGADPDRAWETTVDPWAVVVRHRRWYLLCWSRDKDARRVLRVDRVRRIDLVDGHPGSPATDRQGPPPGLDPLAAVEEQLSQGWRYQVDVVIEAPLDQVRHWLPRSFGRLEAAGDHATRLVATTDEPDWYVARLAELPMDFRVTAGPELREAVGAVAARLTRALSAPD